MVDVVKMGLTTHNELMSEVKGMLRVIAEDEEQGSGGMAEARRFKTFYKQYDGLHDALGEPLIPSQDGAHSRQKMEGQNSRAESNKFGKNLVAQTKSRKITPSLVNKYVTTGKVFKAGDAPDRPRTKSESPRSRSAKV